MSNQKLENLADEFVEAYNAKNFDRMREMITPNFYFHHHNRELEYKDPDEFIVVLKQFATELLPERGFGKNARVTCAGNTVVVEHPWSATPAVDIPGMGDAGETINLDLCTIMVFDGDLLAEYHDYG